MATKRDFAQGFQQRPKEEVKEFWEEIANALNALGPSKDSSTWRKVWIDWKCYIKRKLSANKKEIMSTGGGQCRLQRISPLEEKVIALRGLETCTNGIRCARDYGDSAQVQDVAQMEMDISACSEDRNETPSCSRFSSQRRERTDKESASSLLNEQIALQKQFYEDKKTIMKLQLVKWKKW
uniref:Regulatory protein zeste n=1 Tax=Bactrocera latifrons TaxID=174628 RepID=A0A0K8V1P4_BACLA